MSGNFRRLHPPAPSLSRLHLLLMLVGVIATPMVFASESVCSRPVADAIPLLEKMERAWDEVSDYSAQLRKTERFVDGTVIEERGAIKFRKPEQLYLHVLEGANAGAKLLFPKPGTDSVVLARAGGLSGAVAGFLIKIPAIGKLIPHEFSLDDGRLMNGQHHPLPDSSVAAMMHLVSVNLKAATQHLEGSMCFHQSEFIDGRRATKIEVRLPSDVGTWHTITEGETPWTIAADHGQDRYVILYNNPSVDFEKALAAGDRIFVPRYYAPRALLWISDSFSLPVKLEMFDADNRLYEAYSNADLRINVGLTDEDFDPILHGFPAVTISGEQRSKIHDNSR